VTAPSSRCARSTRTSLWEWGHGKAQRLGIPGESTLGVLDALEFLEEVNSRSPVDLVTRVLIIGGGNSAMDAARSARRLVRDGEVTIVYRRTRAEMPVDAAEVHDCHEKHICIRPLLAPKRIVEAHGKVAGLICSRMRLGEPDSSGRPRPVPIEGHGDSSPPTPSSPRSARARCWTSSAASRPALAPR
jgi:NADPH-dependent glutamate synthase beta subunit-like oxidoreductase